MTSIPRYPLRPFGYTVGWTYVTTGCSLIHCGTRLRRSGLHLSMSPLWRPTGPFIRWSREASGWIAIGSGAFEIFILMAPLRLTTDRFFTRDYRPEVYTQTGIDWINSRTFNALLRTHYPTLKLDPSKNPFLCDAWG